MSEVSVVLRDAVGALQRSDHGALATSQKCKAQAVVVWLLQRAQVAHGGGHATQGKQADSAARMLVSTGVLTRISCMIFAPLFPCGVCRCLTRSVRC